MRSSLDRRRIRLWMSARWQKISGGRGELTCTGLGHDGLHPWESQTEDTSCRISILLWSLDDFFGFFVFNMKSGGLTKRVVDANSPCLDVSELPRGDHVGKLM